jgi:hypothetical protein
VRVNHGSSGAGSGFGEYAALLQMHRFGAYFPNRLGMVTRLLIDRPYRAGTVMARLALAVYEHTRKTQPDIAFCLIDCVPALRGVFLRLGYRQFGPAFGHPTAKLVLPMVFAVYDKHHFQRVRSPLASVCPHHDTLTADWLAHTFAAEFTAHANLAPEAPFASGLTPAAPAAPASLQR